MNRPGTLFGHRLTAKTFVEILRSAHAEGWDIFASGNFSIALEREDAVLKIYEDPGYAAFLADFASRKSSHFPRLLADPVTGDEYDAVFIERLDPLAGQPANFIGDGWCYFSHLKGMSQEIADDIDRNLGPGMGRLVEEIGLYADEKNLEADFKPENFMLRRETSQIVISDPLWKPRLPNHGLRTVVGSLSLAVRSAGLKLIA